MIKLFAIAGVLIVLALVGLYPAYIVWDIGRTAQLPVLSSLSFAQTYALYAVMKAITYPGYQKRKTRSLEETLDESVPELLISITGHTIAWIIFYLIWNYVN